MTLPDDASRQVEAFFGGEAERYDRAYARQGAAGRTLRRRMEIVLSLLGEAGGEVLDAGMGAGVLCAELDRRGWLVTGGDLSSPMVEAARARLPHLRDRLLLGSIHALPFEAGQFDAVVATGVLEYAAADLAGAVGELVRVLRPGGTAVVSFPNRRAPVTMWRDACSIRSCGWRSASIPPADRRRLAFPSLPSGACERVWKTVGLQVEVVEPVGVRPAPAAVAERVEASGSRLAQWLAVQLVVRTRRQT